MTVLYVYIYIDKQDLRDAENAMLLFFFPKFIELNLRGSKAKGLPYRY